MKRWVLCTVLQLIGIFHSYHGFFVAPSFKVQGRARSSSLTATNTDTGTSTTTSVSSNVPASAQILEFVEPQTNTSVILIGTMHYNPTSIALVESSLEHLGRRSRLGPVIIESCDLRWNADATSTADDGDATGTGGDDCDTSSSNMKTFLKNEMRAAHDVAIDYRAPVILGDQRINVTSAAIVATAKETLSDLMTPLGGGWERFYSDVRSLSRAALPSSRDDEESLYIDARGFLDTRLLLSLPTTLVKYPLAWFLRFPLGGTAFVSSLWLLNYVAEITSRASETATGLERFEDLYVSLIVALFEVLILGRIMLKVILADRNEILAKNILAQCFIYRNQRDQQTTNVPNLWQKINSIFHFKGNHDTDIPPLPSPDTDLQIVYAPDSTNLPIPNDKHYSANDKVIVAVLGMAHCNGIMKLLKEQKITI